MSKVVSEFSCLELLPGKIHEILTKLQPSFVSVIWFLACNSFSLWNMWIKLHRNIYRTLKRLLNVTMNSYAGNLGQELSALDISQQIVFSPLFLHFIVYLDEFSHIYWRLSVSNCGQGRQLWPFQLLNYLSLIYSKKWILANNCRTINIIWLTHHSNIIKIKLECRGFNFLYIFLKFQLLLSQTTVISSKEIDSYNLRMRIYCRTV